MTQPSRRAAQPQPRPPEHKRHRKHHPAVPAADMSQPDEAQALQDAEAALGINTFLDPETGEPAEGQSPAFLETEASRPSESEAVPRREDT